MKILLDIPREFVTSDEPVIKWIEKAGDKTRITILPSDCGSLISVKTLKEKFPAGYLLNETICRIIDETEKVVEE